MRIALVEVRHGRHKPSVHRLMQINLRSVWVFDGRQFITGLQETLCRVGRTIRLLKPFMGIKPVFGRNVFHPRMFETAVIENHVHHYLQSFSMCCICQLAIVVIGSKTRINLIIICSGIAVISTETILVIGRVVFQDRCKPQCRYTEFLEIVEMLANTFQVTTMTERGLCAVFLVGIHSFDLCRVMRTLCETVGHQHIKHVSIGESLPFRACFLTLFELVGSNLTFHFSFFVFHLKRQFHRSSFRPFQVHIDQEIVGGIQMNNAVDMSIGIVCCHFLNRCDIFAIDHQLYLGILHTHVPVGRVNTLYVYFSICFHYH